MKDIAIKVNNTLEDMEVMSLFEQLGATFSKTAHREQFLKNKTYPRYRAIDSEGDITGWDIKWLPKKCTILTREDLESLKNQEMDFRRILSEATEKVEGSINWKLKTEEGDVRARILPTDGKKILILGPKRSGKDTLAEIWRDAFGMTFQSSSRAAAEIFLFDALKDKYGYKSVDECFEDRVNHRSEWYDLITEYNTPNKIRLATEILKKSDCYVGMRNNDELLASMRSGLFDLIVYVDANSRVGMEDVGSYSIERGVEDLVIPNNGLLGDFVGRALNLGKMIFNK